MKISHHVLSDVGRRRKSNEDAFLADAEHHLFVVSDGMGGHAAGEVASHLTIEALADAARGRRGPAPSSADATHPPRRADPDETAPPGPGPAAGPDLLRAAIADANERVNASAREKREHRGMAATVVALLLDGDVAHVAHVGDSRAYRLRGGVLELLTVDHSWVGEQVASGALRADEARTHPLRNMVTRAVGGKAQIEVDVNTTSVRADDVFLLCSDGLTGMVSDAEVAQMLMELPDPSSAVPRLVEEANARGGVDNVTVLVVRVEQG
jgi:serine/threonine protein phosphatase PrpC